MKSIVLSSVVVALIVFTGCGGDTPNPATDSKKTLEKKQNKVVQEVENIKTETVSTKNSMINPSNGSNLMSSESSSIANSESFADAKDTASAVDFSTIYFSFDKFTISSNTQTALSDEIQAAQKSSKPYTIKLEGNCDEWGSDEYNFALGLKRANTIKKALVAEGIDGKNISMISYGESNPTCSDKSQECWAKNRRVDFKVAQ